VLGYTLAEASPITAATGGSLRLRFELTGGDLYSYAIN